MSDILLNNLRALKPHYPELFAKLSALAETGTYSLCKTKEGFNDLLIGTPNGPVKLVGEDNPEEEAEARRLARKLKNPVNVVFLGLDLGYDLLDFFKHMPPQTKTLILIEKDPEIFLSLLMTVNLAKYFGLPGVHFVVGEDEARLFWIFHGIMGQQSRFLSIFATHVIDSKGYRLNLLYYKLALKHLRDAAQEHFALAGNSAHDSFVGIINMLQNLDTIALEPGVNRLFGKFAGTPGFVVAAGPSLDKNVELLREIDDRAVILTVDATFKNLLGRGITPNLVTVLERVNLSSKFFDDLTPRECARSVQVSVPVVMPEVYKSYKGPKALLYRPYSHFKWLERDKGTLMTGASSANMAFKLATMMGLDPIILVGQDLAYGDEGQTHTSETFWGQRLEGLLSSQINTIKVPGNLKPEVLTNKAWNAFRIAYIKDVAEFGGTVINATEGGARIDGAKLMTLREAIDGYVKGPRGVGDKVLSLLAREDAGEGKKWLDRIVKDKTPKTARKIRGFIESAQKLLPSIENTKPGDDFEQAFELVGTISRDELLGQSLYHVVQPTVFQVIADYHAIGARASNSAQAHRQRQELLTEALEMLVRMAEKVLGAYNQARDLAAQDQYAANLAYLATSHPRIHQKLVELPKTSYLERKWDEEKGWRLNVKASQPQAEEVNPDPALRIYMGLDIHPGFIDALKNPGENAVGLILVERDMLVFREFLHFADLAMLSASQSIWLLAGLPDDYPAVLADQFPSPQIFCSWDHREVYRLGPDYGKHPDYYESILSKLDQDFAQRRAGALAPQGYLDIMAGLFGHTPELLGIKPVEALKDKLSGKAGLVVLPGANIDVTGPHIKEAAGKLCIISVPSMLNGLRKYGIEPQFMVCGHMGGPEKARIKELMEGLDKTVVAAPLFALKNVMDVGAGPKCFFPDPPNYATWLFGRQLMGLDLSSNHFSGTLALGRHLGLNVACMGYLKGEEVWRQMARRATIKYGIPNLNASDETALKAFAAPLKETPNDYSYLDLLRPLGPEPQRERLAKITRDLLPAVLKTLDEKKALVKSFMETGEPLDPNPRRAAAMKKYFEPGTGSFATQIAGHIHLNRWVALWTDHLRDGTDQSAVSKDFGRILADIVKTLDVFGESLSSMTGALTEQD